MAKLINKEEIGNVSGGMKIACNSILFENDEECRVFDEFMKTEEAQKLEKKAFDGKFCVIAPLYGDPNTTIVGNTETIIAFKNYCESNRIGINFEN